MIIDTRQPPPPTQRMLSPITKSRSLKKTFKSLYLNVSRHNTSFVELVATSYLVSYRPSYYRRRVRGDDVPLGRCSLSVECSNAAPSWLSSTGGSGKVKRVRRL